MRTAKMARSRFPLTRPVRGRPLPHPDPQAPYAPDPRNAGGHRRIHPAILGGLGRELPQGGEAEVDGRGGETGGLEMRTKLLEGGTGEGTGAEEGQEVV
jgi:hypothetical protein